MRRGVKCAATLAFVLVTGACAGPGRGHAVGRPVPTAPAAAAADDEAAPVTVGSTILRAAATTAALRARTSVSVTTTRDAVGPPAFALAGTGEVDLRSGAATLTVTVPQVGARPLRARVSAGKVLVQVGGRWTPLAGEGAGQADPSIPLAVLAAVTDRADVTGHDDVRSVPATHYRSTIDLQAARRRRDLAPTVRAALDRLSASVAANQVPVDVWLDRAGRARRIVLVFTLGDNATVRVQQDLYDFAA